MTYSVVSLEPPLEDIDHNVEQLEQAIDELCRATDSTQVWVIAHSMGGLAIRAYVRAKGDDKIAAAMTLGSPHQGTMLWLFGFGRNARQMMLGSRWLNALSQSKADQLFRRKLTVLWTPQDNIVVPQTSSVLPGTRAIQINGCGHMAMLDHPHVKHIVADWLSIR